MNRRFLARLAFLAGVLGISGCGVLQYLMTHETYEYGRSTEEKHQQQHQERYNQSNYQGGGDGGGNGGYGGGY